MCHHIPLWRIWLLSFGKAEEAFKMSLAKLCAKKTVVLLKMLYCRVSELRWCCVDICWLQNSVGPPNSCPENEGLLMWITKWKSEAHVVGLEFVCEAQAMKPGYSTMTLRLNSKACSGNTPVLQAFGNSRCRHQLAR